MVKNVKELKLKIKNIFYNLIRGACALVLALVFVSPAVADGDCANEDNDAINPAFAMCSTHAYNIGMKTNPESSDRVAMQEVIGLKTTFFTQQLYKQYDQLESMVRRLKTQLKKAVMTSNLKAAGAQSEKDDGWGSSSGTGNKYKYLAAADDCSEKFTDMEMYDCLKNNFEYIKRETQNSNPSAQHKKQLANDYKVGNCDDELGETTETKCATDNGWKNKKDYDDCFRKLQLCIRTGMEAAKDKEASRNNPWQKVMNNRD